MNPISDLITKKADVIFAHSPALAQENTDRKDEVLNLENYDNEETTLDTVQNNEIKIEIKAKSSQRNQIAPDSKQMGLAKLKSIAYSIKNQLDALIRHLENMGVDSPDAVEIEILEKSRASEQTETSDKVLQGFFDGEKMIDEYAQEYVVPPNYASKSKLVGGDTLKLTITDRGKFIYKQINRVERERKVGKLAFNPASELWHTECEGRIYKLLTASVTFYKGRPGDEVFFFIAKGLPCTWGAVDHIIKIK